MASILFHPHHFRLFLHSQNQVLCFLNCRHLPSQSTAAEKFMSTLPSAEVSPPLHICRSNPWDSNAGSYTTQELNFNRNDDSEGDSEDSLEQWAEVLEDYIDSIWILKVFSSFGLMLPAIVLSMLLANGPKAFLLALALPLGQSTFAFGFKKMQENGKNRPKLKTKRIKNGRSRARSSRNIKLEQEQAKFVGSQEARSKKNGYQSWVSKTDVSISSDDSSSVSFGGWDGLDETIVSAKQSTRKAAPKSSRLQKTPAKKGKLRRRWRDSDLPLLLRLLVSIFPFPELLD